MSDAAEPRNNARHRSRWGLLAIVSLALGGVSLWLLHKGALPVWPNAELLRGVSATTVATFSALWLLVLFLRGYRWRWQLELITSVTTRNVLAVSVIGSAATILMPLRSGEFVRPLLLSRKGQVPFFAALGTIACERLLDSLCAASLLVVCLLGAEVNDPLPDHIGGLPIPAALVPGLGYSAGLATLLAVFFAFMFFYFRARTVRVLELLTQNISPRLAPWVEIRLDDLTRGLTLLRDPRVAPRYLLTTLLYWFSHLLAVWYLLVRCGLEGCSLAQAGVVLGILSFGSSLPSAPGFFGVFQISIYAALALFYPASLVQSAGGLAAFLLYVLELGWILMLAPIALLIQERKT